MVNCKNDDHIGCLSQVQGHVYHARGTDEFLFSVQPESYQTTTVYDLSLTTLTYFSF